MREVARQAKHDFLLTVSDKVRFHEPTTLNSLCSILEHDGAAASASCGILAEKVLKRQVVLQPAAGGLFPSAVSFLRAPHLSFTEPDVLEALPDLDYPVVANSLLLTLFRRTAVAKLSLPSEPISSNSDIRLGLDLVAAGYRNWCTTRFMASLTGPYIPRDSIDPVGGCYAEPHRWEEVLGRVALVRELL